MLTWPTGTHEEFARASGVHTFSSRLSNNASQVLPRVQVNEVLIMTPISLCNARGRAASVVQLVDRCEALVGFGKCALLSKRSAGGGHVLDMPARHKRLHYQRRVHANPVSVVMSEVLYPLPRGRGGGRQPRRRSARWAGLPLTHPCT